MDRPYSPAWMIPDRSHSASQGPLHARARPAASRSPRRVSASRRPDDHRPAAMSPGPSIGSAFSRSIRSTCSCAPTTCRSSRGSAPMTAPPRRGRLPPAQAQRFRVLGARGFAGPASTCSRSSAGAWSGPRAARASMAGIARFGRERRDFIDDGVAGRSRRAARSAPGELTDGGPAAPGLLVGLERRQARPRMAVLGRARSRLRRGAASSGSTT